MMLSSRGRRSNRSRTRSCLAPGTGRVSGGWFCIHTVITSSFPIFDPSFVSVYERMPSWSVRFDFDIWKVGERGRRDFRFCIPAITQAHHFSLIIASPSFSTAHTTTEKTLPITSCSCRHYVKLHSLLLSLDRNQPIAQSKVRYILNLHYWGETDIVKTL